MSKFITKSNGVTLEMSNGLKEPLDAFNKCHTSAEILEKVGDGYTVIRSKLERPVKLEQVASTHM